MDFTSKSSCEIGNALKIKLKESFAKMLLDTITTIKGAQKDLVLDPNLISCLDHFASISDLKAKGVDKIFKLEPGVSPGSSPKCVYIIRSQMLYVRYIADHINADQHSGRLRQYCILFVPQKLYSCELILEQEGVYGLVETMEFPLGLIPLDMDLYSLELPTFFPSYFLNGDSQPFHHVALSLDQLQRILGPFSNIFGQGTAAKAVIEKLQFLQKERPSSDYPADSLVDGLIILDRDLDYVSLFLSQLTYQGLLDESFGINSGKVTFGKNVTGSDVPVKHPLNKSDPVFREIADLHFTKVFGIFKDKGKLLQKKYDESQNMNVGGLKSFVSNELRNLKLQHKSLALHIGACEVIMSEKKSQDFEMQLKVEHSVLDGTDIKEGYAYIQECIHRQKPMFMSLRLLCLMSLCQGGLWNFKTLLTEFLQSYGHKHLLTISNLQKLGIISDLDGTVTTTTLGRTVAAKVVTAAVSTLGLSPFRTVVKRFNLIPKVEENQQKPHSNPSYVFGGAFIPLISRLVDLILQRDGIQGNEELFKLLPGNTFTVNTRPKGHSLIKLKVVLVYVLGGLTYAELSALRLVSNLRGVPVLVATTSLVNGNAFLSQLAPNDSTFLAA